MITLIPTKKGFLIKDHDINCLYTINNPIFQIRTAFPHLRKRPLVIGLVGPRGSGKSVNTGRQVILEHMLKKQRVWANMDIKFNILHESEIVEFHANNWDKLDIVDLDTIYEDGCLVIEEANMTMMEARRAMKEENLKFSYILQQLRKRRMNLIWNAQSEMHCDDRLRFQTDIFIKCTDVSLLPGHRHVGVGEMSLCKYYDYSGVVTGRINSIRGWIEPFWQGIIWNKPWWNAIDTFKMQGIEEEETASVSDYELKIQDMAGLAMEMKEYILESGGKVSPRNLWKQYNITALIDKQIMGQALSRIGVFSNSNRTYYQVDMPEGEPVV